ncbi:hypothetical protein JTE90_020432 [Oedothorax gibbosus]|uniref:Carboxylesterase type B domain-containing protein n=1 Tax=Oedothorax gibbosus TaxID=931172 RepID=A0AAV6TCF2_9ARAC|nr:hypothetical protein JTE90_020432 [Oedothorax gibbosus]
MAKMGTMLTSLVVLLACCVFSILGQEDERPVVQTKYGKIRGRVRVHSTGAKVNEFLGVPYAAPPVGDLRFKKTVKPENFTEDIFEADKMPPACHQYSDQPLPWYDLDPGQSEDCLYLNIWAPANPAYKNRQTTIYVHGGGWFEGGSNRMGYYDGFGDALDTMDENGISLLDGVVVVMVNYRLDARRGCWEHGFVRSRPSFSVGLGEHCVHFEN